MALYRGPIIITGGAGFLGANLAAHLLASDTGADILVVDDLRRGSWDNLLNACQRAHVPAYPGDFLADACADIEWRDFLEDIEPAAVFHLAGGAMGKHQTEKQYLFDQIEGFRGLLYAAIDLGVPLVYASDAAVYGVPEQARSGKKIPEPAAGMPGTIEGFAKWIIENIHRQALALRDASDPPAHVVGLRIFGAFGPGEERDGPTTSLPGRLATRWKRAERPSLGPADWASDFIPVRDVVTCLVAATARGVESGVYNCGSGEAITNADLVGALRDGMGLDEAEAPIEFADPPAQTVVALRADVSAVARRLDWRPAQPALDAIREYGAWLASNHEASCDHERQDR